MGHVLLQVSCPVRVGSVRVGSVPVGLVPVSSVPVGLVWVGSVQVSLYGYLRHPANLKFRLDCT